MEVGWILLSASSYNLLWYVALVKVDEENLAPHRYVFGKGSILTAFSHNYGNSSLIPNPDSTKVVS